MSSNDKSQYKPVLGFFYLSKAERIVFAILTLLIGGLICSYKNQEIYQLLIDGKEHDVISGWFTIPFLLISWVFLDPVLEPKWVTRMKIGSNETKNPVKIFVIDMLAGLVFIILLQIIYAFSTYFLFLLLWR